MTAPRQNPAPPLRPPRRSRRWLVFFAVLALLALAAVAIEVWYNLRQQLKPAQLEAAQTLWHDRGPASYDLRYLVKRQTARGDRLVAQVGGDEVGSIEADGAVFSPAVYAFYGPPGSLMEAELDPAVHDEWREVDWALPTPVSVSYAVAVRGGRVVRVDVDDLPLPAVMERYCDMSALLAGVGQLLERDARAGDWRMYNVASFDPADGHLLHYVRSSMRTRERLEFILIRLDPVADNGP